MQHFFQRLDALLFPADLTSFVAHWAYCNNPNGSNLEKAKAQQRPSTLEATFCILLQKCL